MTTHTPTEKLFADLEAVVRDAEALLKATAGQANEKVQEVRARAEESIRQARSQIEAAEDETVRRVKELASATEGYVREKPWQAIGLAAGLGLLIGLALSRR